MCTSCVADDTVYLKCIVKFTTKTSKYYSKNTQKINDPPTNFPLLYKTQQEEQEQA